MAIVCVLAIAGAARSEEWNLFAVSMQTPPECVDDWQMFQQRPIAQADDVAWNLFASTTVTAHKTLDTSVLAAASEVLSRHAGSHVLFFTDAGCQPCKWSNEHIVPEIKGKGWPVHEISYAADPEAFDALKVEAVPTFVAVRRAVDCGRFTGASPEGVYGMLHQANAVELD